jgi:4-diphosphocytidyl-2-C-methyl-D-erythritol kinase
VPLPRVEDAPAKVNLTLRVIGRRPDGYHEIESLVAFASIGDALAFVPGARLDLTVRGPTAAAAGEPGENLVLKAAQALAKQVPGLELGSFVLSKRLPVAAGLGGGSADAAAALRLIARHNRLAPDDPRVMAAARATGADVPVCLDPRPRLMRGVGEVLSPPLRLARLPALLINPGVSVPTRDVFATLNAPPLAKPGAASAAAPALPAILAEEGREKPRDALVDFLSGQANDLEAAAVSLHPIIADALTALRALAGCRLARMSGSGATCYALFDSARAAASAARGLRAAYPKWWIRESVIGHQ